VPSKSEIEYINTVADVNGAPHYSEELSKEKRERYQKSQVTVKDSVSPAQKKADWLKEDLRPSVSINDDGNVI